MDRIGIWSSKAHKRPPRRDNVNAQKLIALVALGRNH